MSSFVQVDQNVSHPGVERAERVIAYVQEQAAQFSGTRTLGVVLLAAVVAAVMGLADLLVTELSGGGVFTSWMVMWLVAFVAIALFAGLARGLAGQVLSLWQDGQSRRAASRADEQLLAMARTDARVMSDLKAAMTRDERWEPAAQVASQVSAKVLQLPITSGAARGSNSNRYY